jgi:hypothetical protein
VDEFRRRSSRWCRGQAWRAARAVPGQFQERAESRGYLEWLLEQFRDYPVAVELRHKGWSDDPVETLQVLAAFGAALAQIDEPKFRLSIRQDLLPNVKTFYYLRLHGRNAAAVVAHGDVGGPLQLPVLGRRAAAVRGGGRGGVTAGQEGVPLHQQPLLGEVGGQRRDPEARARAGPARASTRSRSWTATRT